MISHKHLVLPVLLATVIAGGSTTVRAAEPDASALVAEFTGQSAAQSRTPDQLTAAYAQVLESLLPNMASTDLPTRNSAENTWERVSLHAGQPGHEAQRVAAATAMLPKLAATTPQFPRVWLLKQLEHVGGAESVPSLVGLLNDNDTLVKEQARRALSNNPSRAAEQLLIAELGKAAAPEWRLAIINALGYRRSAAAAGAVAKYLTDPDEHVAGAAIGALARIGGPVATNALAAYKGRAPAALRPAVTDAYLLMADRLRADGNGVAAAKIYQEVYAPDQPRRVRIAALHGLVLAQGASSLPLLTGVLTGQDAQVSEMAARFAGEVSGAPMTTALAGLLPRVPAATKLVVLDELSRRGAAARPAVLAALKDNDESVRIAALQALTTLGNTGDVTLLARTAATATGAEGAAALDTLDRVPGRDVDAAIAAAMTGADAKLRVALVRSLAARHVTTATPALVLAAQDPDTTLRTEAVKALGQLGDAKSVPVLVDLLVKAEDDNSRSGAQQALISVSDRVPDRAAAAGPILVALPAAKGPARIALLGTLKSFGGTPALDAVRAATQDNDVQVQDAAIHALADWPDAAALPDLQQLAANGTEGQQVLALRGYVRLVSAGNQPVGDKVKLLQLGLENAKRPEEKRLFLGGLGALNSPDALKLVTPYLDDPALGQEAAAATVSIIRLQGRRNDPDTAAALRKVIAVAKTPAVIRDANMLIRPARPVGAGPRQSGADALFRSGYGALHSCTP